MKFVLLHNQFLHNKNLKGLRKMMEKLDYEYIESNEQGDGDIIYAPIYPVKQLPGKKYIFGPHFSVYPNHLINYINNENAIYIQPSEWVLKFWESIIGTKLRLKSLAFSVDTDLFNEEKTLEKRINDSESKIFIYYKSRHPNELKLLEDFLQLKNINYHIFDYIKKYSETDYINYLKSSKYGIILGRHESQGFAIEEALSCNVPLLVWNAKSMNQEYGYNYEDIPSTTVPYWDERCGELFNNYEELGNTFDIFISKLKSYRPREYILENLSAEKCAERLKNLIDAI